MKTDGRIDMSRPVEIRKVTHAEHVAMLDQSEVLAVFVQVGDAVGLMMHGDEPLTRDEKACLIRAARALPTRD